MNTNQSWLDQVSAVVAHVTARLEGLGETERVHIETLTAEVAETVSINQTTLKLLVSSLVDSLPGFKVVRGKFGGAMRDTEANRPKADQRAAEVAKRKEERAAKKALAAAEKASKPARTKKSAETASSDAPVAETTPANDQEAETAAEAV